VRLTAALPSDLGGVRGRGWWPNHTRSREREVLGEHSASRWI
jgi:hypothetical protein